MTTETRLGLVDLKHALENLCCLPNPFTAQDVLDSVLDGSVTERHTEFWKMLCSAYSEPDSLGEFISACLASSVERRAAKLVLVRAGILSGEQLYAILDLSPAPAPGPASSSKSPAPGCSGRI